MHQTEPVHTEHQRSLVAGSDPPRDTMEQIGMKHSEHCGTEAGTLWGLAGLPTCPFRAKWNITFWTDLKVGLGQVKGEHGES